MHTNTGRADLTVFAKDYPEVRLVAETKSSVAAARDLDAAVKQVARYMWGANCHYGLIVTPDKTYVLRDDFTAHGPESIRVSDVLSTKTLLGRFGAGAVDTTERQFEHLVREWLEVLAASYEAALPDDPAVMRAFFPDIVGAVAEGRVVAEAPMR